MRILFDQGTPVPLRKSLPGQIVITAYEKGWSMLQNGDLLTEAEKDAFDLLVTTDQNLKFQQHVVHRKIAILVLPTTRWAQIRSHISEVVTTVQNIKPGEYRELSW